MRRFCALYALISEEGRGEMRNPKLMKRIKAAIRSDYPDVNEVSEANLNFVIANIATHIEFYLPDPKTSIIQLDGAQGRTGEFAEDAHFW